MFNIDVANIAPPFLRVKPLVHNTLGMKVTKCSSHQFLGALIRKCHAVVNGVGKTTTSLLNHLASVLDIEDLKAHASCNIIDYNKIHFFL